MSTFEEYGALKFIITHSPQQTKIHLAVSVDRDETDNNELSHQGDLHCLPFCFEYDVSQMMKMTSVPTEHTFVIWCCIGIKGEISAYKTPRPLPHSQYFTY